MEQGGHADTGLAVATGAVGSARTEVLPGRRKGNTKIDVKHYHQAEIWLGFPARDAAFPLLPALGGRPGRPGRWGSANAGVFSVSGCVPRFARPVRRGWDTVPTAPPTLGLADAPVMALVPASPTSHGPADPHSSAAASPKDTKMSDLKRFRIQQGNSPPTLHLHGFVLLPLPSVAKSWHGAVPQFPHS